MPRQLGVRATYSPFAKGGTSRPTSLTRLEVGRTAFGMPRWEQPREPHAQPKSVRALQSGRHAQGGSALHTNHWAARSPGDALRLHVAAPNIEPRTDCIAIAHGAHPIKGSLLFARRNIEKGERVAEEPMSEVISDFISLDAFKALLSQQTSATERKRLLRQSCPTGDGRVALESQSHFNTYFSHAAQPNMQQDASRFTASRVVVVATRAVLAGEELTVDCMRPSPRLHLAP